MILVSRAYASFAVLVLLIKLLMSPCYNLLMWKLQNKIGSFEVAPRVDLVKVVKLMMDLRSGRLNLFVMWWNFENWCVSSYINWLFHLILSIALLFELLMYWWRNWWVELCWYKMFLCGFEVFECFEELFFVDALFDVFNVNALLKIC